MNARSKQKFIEAVNRKGLEAVCRLPREATRERHRTKGGIQETVLSYDSLTVRELHTAKEILPKSFAHRSVFYKGRK